MLISLCSGKSLTQISTITVHSHPEDLCPLPVQLLGQKSTLSEPEPPGTTLRKRTRVSKPIPLNNPTKQFTLQRAGHTVCSPEGLNGITQPYPLTLFLERSSPRACHTQEVVLLPLTDAQPATLSHLNIRMKCTTNPPRLTAARSPPPERSLTL